MNASTLKIAVLSALSAVITAIVFILSFSFFTYGSENPESFRAVCGVISLLFGGFACGIFPFIYGAEKNYGVALLSGGFFCAVVLALSAISGGDGSFLTCIIKISAVILCCFLSSALSIKSKTKRKSRKRRR